MHALQICIGKAFEPVFAKLRLKATPNSAQGPVNRSRKSTKPEISKKFRRGSADQTENLKSGPYGVYVLRVQPKAFS